jgi:hypothetical protein
MISEFFPIYIGPPEALSVANSSLAPSSIKIFSGAIMLLLAGMDCDLLPLVNKSKSS